MKKLIFLAILIAGIVISAAWLWPFPTASESAPIVYTPPLPDPRIKELTDYLTGKKSPLAKDAEYLITLPHWELVVAVSNAESSFCRHQLNFNCWGIEGRDGHYLRYQSFAEAAKDTNDLIEKWQKKGRWLTPADMNGSYVVPASANWLRTVNLTLKDLQNLEAPK